MKLHHRGCFLLCLAVLTWGRAGIGALNVSLTQRDVERALKLANAPEAARAQFHAPYILPVTDATVEQIEVVTEFRRYVLAAEEQLRLGNWTVARGSRSLDGRGIADNLQKWKGRVSIVTRLRFHPQNNYQSVPPFENIVGEPQIAPLDTIRTPLLALASGRRGPNFPPVMGASVETVFDADSIGQASRPIRVVLNGQEFKRLTVDFSRLE